MEKRLVDIFKGDIFVMADLNISSKAQFLFDESIIEDSVDIREG